MCLLVAVAGGYPTELHGQNRRSAEQLAPAMGRPIVIGHRGASGHRPEHTLAAYELAIDQGADFVEPDLVITKDGVLVARHEHRIDETTDVAVRFPQRRTIKRVGTRADTGWFVEDFTLAELRNIRATERLATRSQAYNGQFGVPTFDEVLDLVARKSRETGRAIGVFPETKSPSYFREIGLPLEEPLVAALKRRGLDRSDAPVFIQSFEVANLKRLRAMTQVRLVQLIDASGAPDDAAVAGVATYAAMVTPAGLREVARYAAGVGLAKRLIVPVQRDGTTLPPTTVVADAHAVGLLVHAWTFRSDAQFLPRAYGGDHAAEYREFAALGVDGVFSDFPDHAVAALRPR
jgi:glycerophosphoryl diester phosphodiesterase